MFDPQLRLFEAAKPQTKRKTFSSWSNLTQQTRKWEKWVNYLETQSLTWSHYHEKEHG